MPRSWAQGREHMSSDDSDDDDDVPLNPSVVKPKAPDGVGSFQLRGGVPPGVEKLGEAAEESAAIAGEDVTVVLQFPDREISVQVRACRPQPEPARAARRAARSRAKPAASRPPVLPRVSDEDGAHSRAAQAQSEGGAGQYGSQTCTPPRLSLPRAPRARPVACAEAHAESRSPPARPHCPAQEMRLAESDQVMIDPLSLNDYPVAGQKVLRVKVTEL